MLVGNKSITLGTALRNCRTPEQALRYAIDCVPPPLRHVRAIVDNQRYFIATLINGAVKLPYVKRKAICDELTKGIRVHGVVNTMYDYCDLLSCIDTDMWEVLTENASR